MTTLAVAALPVTGAPQVGITLAGLPAVATVTVERSWDGGYSWHAVRDAVDRPVSGGSTFIRDFVPPLNVACTYRVLVGTSTTPDATAQITVPSTSAWLQDPLSPRTAVRVSAERLGNGDTLLTQGSLASATWAQDADVAVPSGASYPVASVGQRLMAGEVPLVLSVEGMAAEAGALYRLMMTSGTVVLRGLPAGGPLDEVAHVVTGSATTSYVGRNQVTTWSLKARQVRPAGLKIVVPWWTYDQVREAWAASTAKTYDEVKAYVAGSTYVQVQADPVP